MSNEILKINTSIVDDAAIDFERLLMVFKIGKYTKSKQEQQSIMIGAAMLVLDATKEKYAQSSGKRYPTLQEVLEYVNISQADIDKLFGNNDGILTTLTAAVASTESKS